MIFQRVFLTDDPFHAENDGKGWFALGRWPASWIAHPATPANEFAVAYRKTFKLDEAATIRAHVTGDERYELFIDGQRVALGSERGDANNWFYETYEFQLEAGEHTIVGIVFTVGKERAYAQMTVRHGFLFMPQSEAHRALLGTGTAEWEARLVHGLEWISQMSAWGTGRNLKIEGANYPWGIECGEGDGWVAAEKTEEAVEGQRFNEAMGVHFLRPAILPAMLDERRHVGTVRLVSSIPELKTSGIPVRTEDDMPEETMEWQRLIEGSGRVHLGPHTLRRVILDLDDYYCARPELTTSGGAGATVRVNWQEALYDHIGSGAYKDKAWTKGNRDVIEGKYFTCCGNAEDGVGDIFLPEGGDNRVYTPFWWQAGRYVEISLQTGEEALTIEDFCIRETRYPMELESRFSSDDERMERIAPIMMRALQMCSHETYMDCPFYEQLMYIGDTRLEVLTTFAATADDRLPRKASLMFDASRQLNGLTQSRYPTKYRQIIPPFSLWHVCMIHDRALWKDTMDFDGRLLPGARGVLDYFLSRRNAAGLVEAPEGWNYTDWVPSWVSGEPPGARDGVNCTLNWQMVLTLRKMADLENWHGEPELAARWTRCAQTLKTAIDSAFWNDARRLYAEDKTHGAFSQHAQCLAVLSGALEEDASQGLIRRLLASDDLDETTIMFRFYLMEALYQTRNGEALLDQLPLWYQLPAWGFKTTWEEADPNSSRSDCHAWGAHPLFHYFASVLGIRPASRGFATVHIAPQLGELKQAKGQMPHPAGSIEVELDRSSAALLARISLPAGVTGNFEWNGQLHPLNAGQTKFEL